MTKITYTGGGSGSPLYKGFSSDTSLTFFFIPSCKQKYTFLSVWILIYNNGGGGVDDSDRNN
jgi:hypothetical protein